MMLVRRLPMLLLALGGILFALIRWKVHPRVSLITIAALILYLLDAVLFNVFLYWLPQILEPMRLSSSGSRWMYSIIYFCEDFFTAAIILLLVAAAFIGRKSSSQLAPETI